ncbi:nicotinate-nucleotide-dimethylbenzimidazole phosphoribosyltransferase /cob(II)yrinic acid a,c-diamide reductase [Streptomyces sp. TLI_55]|uniref:nicotinate-nucleotide--dimethylbenzimidazole phosphoribosyltransferase n=1 Tax=Streptomyces sp. TLI_55 TaxID=1938861 RepID=UPI000BD1C463|nr:nicotinate-nucleotide--dimethylbenzimidazole phosphoribosyltransferase [Streptomyces sp. TLI_55]SNX57107.1 nicotinate-nucleotide-dimethylbenzimidazole phosphoribosyltransferase /cob(II)yrinic acid a,c-diamide reductase [Streptomyces sp. TLI_55]
MTDTGQVPGEGLPENAGMVEQPGVPAHGAYTYLSETTAEDEDLLLLPGAQGAWGNEVAPPAPEPVVETVHAPPAEAAQEPPTDPTHQAFTDPAQAFADPAQALADPAHHALADPAHQAFADPVHQAFADPGHQPLADAAHQPLADGMHQPPADAAHQPFAEPAQEALGAPVPDASYGDGVHEPGPHEMSGRDSGSVDLGGVRLPAPQPAATARSAPSTPIPPITPRRPLHLGPPIPDASASPVRSLADRGPAGAPTRHAGPPTSGPEYLDVPQPLREMAPQGATAWGAPAPAGAVAQTAETVVPTAGPAVQHAPEPVGAAQAAVARVATQTGAVGGEAQSESAPVGDEGVLVEGEGVPVAGAGVDADGGTVPADEAVVPAATDAPAASTAPVNSAASEASTAAQAPDAGEVPATVSETGAAGVGEQPVVDAAVTDAGQDQVVGVAPEAEAAHTVDAAQGIEPPVASEPAETEELIAPQPQEAPVAEVPADAGQPVAAEASDPATDLPQGPAAPEVAEPEATAPTAPAPEVVPAPSEADVEQPASEPPLAATPEADGATLDAEATAPEAAATPSSAAVADQLAQPEGAPATPAEPIAAAAATVVEPSPEATPGTEPLPGPADITQAQTEQPADLDPQQADPAAQQADPTASHNAVAASHTPDDPQPEAPAATPVDAPATAPLDAPAPAPLTDAAHPADLQPAPASEPAQAPAPADAPQADTPQPSALPTPPHALADQPAGPQVLFMDQATPAQTPAAPDLASGAPWTSHPEQPVGQFVPVEGSVPTTPHLAPTPPQPLVLPAEAAETAEAGQAPETGAAEALPAQGQPAVPAPRDGDGDPELDDAVLAQNADDLDTRAADQEESTATVEEVRQSTGPAAPAYDDAEREAVLKVMRERRDIRNGFRSDPIPHEVLLRVLEAAHTAPSVGHSQPWDFVVIRSADTRRSMHELAMRQRDAYAKSLPKGRAKQFKELKIEAILDTPVNIVVTADPTRGGRHTLGRHTQPQMAPYSAALAVENLWLAARAEGLGVGWVSFFDEREMVRALGLPEHLEVIAYLCVGYVDEFPDEPELMQAGWSKRRPLSWVVHEETYGRRALPGEEPHDLLAETVSQIRPLDAKALGEAWERQKRMTKPAGALGMLEIISAQLSGLSRQCPPPIPEPAAVAIFAGDHGVHAQGVTPWPQEVTAQMVANFLGGGAVCNAFASQVGAEVCVVDVGVAADLPATPGLLPRKVRAGTSDMTTGPAMTREEAKQAIEVGIETARDLVAAGNKALLTGEMGIANTTASAALISVFTDTDPAEVTGRGTGINDETLARKTEVVRRAIEVHQPDPADPIGVLAAIGGFEHAAMVGLLLGGASLRTPVILDGVSAGAAALVARAIAPEVLAACIAGHRSAEPGHVAALNKLGLRPLVDLDLRLGEGTGALLALPLVQSTARAMHEVATFDSAGVTEK